MTNNNLADALSTLDTALKAYRTALGSVQGARPSEYLRQALESAIRDSLDKVPSAETFRDLRADAWDLASWGAVQGDVDLMAAAIRARSCLTPERDERAEVRSNAHDMTRTITALARTAEAAATAYLDAVGEPTWRHDTYQMCHAANQLADAVAIAERGYKAAALDLAARALDAVNATRRDLARVAANAESEPGDLDDGRAEWRTWTDAAVEVETNVRQFAQELSAIVAMS